MMVVRLLLVIACAVALLPSRGLAQTGDPVQDFLVHADSLARADDPERLREAVRAHEPLVGAAVGTLLDVAFQIEDEQPEPAQENVQLAAKLADVHAEVHGSAGLQSLVQRHREWSADQRAVKRRAQALEAEANALRQAGDLDGAVKKLEAANRSYRSIGDVRAQAVVWGTLGVVHWSRNDWDAVRANYERALRARREIEDRILEGRTLNGLGSVRLTTGDPAGALEWYERAIALREKTGDRVGLATSLTYAGQCAEQLGRVLQARQLFQRARPILETAGDAARLAELEISVGTLYNTMQRSSEALVSLDRALGLIEAVPHFEPLVRLQRATALRDQGRLRESLDEIRAAEDLASGADDPVFAAQLSIARGLTRLELGELESARIDLEQARDLADQLGVPEWSAATRANIALVYISNARPREALAAADSALARVAKTQDRATQRLATEIAAEALYALRRFDEALVRADEALKASARESQENVNARLQRAKALARLGREDEAREENRLVLRQLRSSGRTDLLFAPLLGLGDSFERSAPDSARHYYRRALEVLEQQRAAAGSAAVRTSFLAARRGLIYEEMVHYYARRHLGTEQATWSDEAFATAERARARGLLELLGQSYDPSTDAQVQELLDRLYALGDPSPETRDERLRLEDDLAGRFDAYLRDAAPLVASTSLARTPRDLGALLDTGTAVLAYSVGDSASYVWAIDAQGTELFSLPSRARLREEVIALRQALQVQGFGDARLAGQAALLHRLLVAPAGERLKGKKSLVVIPDDVLFDLPFELLLTREAGDEPDWRRASFLAKQWNVSYAPSASVYLQLRQQPVTSSSPRVLAVGDPDFRGLVPRAGLQEALPPLPNSRDEVAALDRLRPGAVTGLIGAQATEAALRGALRRDRPGIVHLATHGLVDREEPSLTSIAFAPSASSGDDGYLHTLEILALPLDTELVVLSACDTGRGKLERGEGTIGLTRSFFAAGARRVVASLWPVADASTATLMESFYEELLRRGRPVDEALNRARARLWSKKDTAHPYYWSPFVLMGSDRPLPPSVRG